MIRGENYRITVLTDRLLRLEYSADGRFEDRATQTVLNRDFPTPEFTLTRTPGGVLLRSASLKLEYDEGPFSTGGLVLTPIGGRSFHQVWRYGEVPQEWAVSYTHLTLPTNREG